MKRIAIVGGAGRMGQILAKGLAEQSDFHVTALVDVHEPRELGSALYAKSVDDLDASSVDVVVDFSVPESVVASANWCAANKVALVVGTTGLDTEQRAAVLRASDSTAVVLGANFSLGAVLSERFAAQAAPYFNRVEVIELHHDDKVDAPSGTSIEAVRSILEARRRANLPEITEPTTRFSLEGSRGADAGDGVRIHSVRLPGLVAHQEILFGGPGEGLTIRHDSYDRVSYVPGVALAIRSMPTTCGLSVGIDGFIK